MEPYEVKYTKIGNKRIRTVYCIICPTILGQIIRRLKPIIVPCGDITVDWQIPQSKGLSFYLNNISHN